MANPKRRKEKKMINGGGNENTSTPAPEAAKPAPAATPKAKPLGIIDKVKSKLKSE